MPGAYRFPQISVVFSKHSLFKPGCEQAALSGSLNKTERKAMNLVVEVYLDNSSTTGAYKECADAVADVMFNTYGNPSSLHRKGIEAEKLVKTAKERIANTIKAQPNEIYFTSGGTEADNLAIMGACGANRGKHIISLMIEHPAVLNTLSHMEAKGYSVDLMPVLRNGMVDADKLAGLIRKDTCLVSVMYVNNEIGTVEPIEKIGQIIKRKNPSVVFHVDAVQAYGKIPFTAMQTGADLISLSAHKIHGPKGVGALYIKNKTKIAPILFGGGQQNNIRPGTENVPGIVGFGIAAELACKDIEETSKRMEYLRNRLCSIITSHLDDVAVNTPLKYAAPHILNISFGHVRSEVLLHSLEADGIYVSSGSACSSHKKGPSYVLTAIGSDRKMIDGSIRFSLCEFNTEQEIDYAADKVIEHVKKIRRLLKR